MVARLIAGERVLGMLQVDIWSRVVAQPPFNKDQTPREIPADRYHQRPSTSRPTRRYDTTMLFADLNCTNCSRTTKGHQRSHCVSPSSLCWSVCPPTSCWAYSDWSKWVRHWAGTYRRWRLQRRHCVLFSDESRSHLRNDDGRLVMWSRRGERYYNECLVQTDRWDGGGVSWCGAGSVIITEQHSLLFLVLSPLQRLWCYLGLCISRPPQMNNRRELESAPQQEWNVIPQNTIRRLIGSMRRRCMACVAARAGRTDFPLWYYMNSM